MQVTRFQFVIACLLMFAVAMVFIAPSVDLDPTTLGSQQAAMLAMSALLAACTVLSAVLIPTWSSVRGWSFESAAVHFFGLLDLICTRLC